MFLLADVTNRLFDELSSQNDKYIAIIGLMVSIFSITIGFYSFQQWRLSEKQIEKMKEEFKEDFKIEFKREFKIEFKREFKITEMDRAVSETKNVQRTATKKINEMERVISDAQEEIRRIKNYDLEGKAELLSHINKGVSDIAASNAVRAVTRSLYPIVKQNDLMESTLANLMTYTLNGLMTTKSMNFPSDGVYLKDMANLVDVLSKQYDLIDEDSRSERLVDVKKRMDKVYAGYLKGIEASNNGNK